MPRSYGQVTTAATTEVAIDATAYTEEVAPGVQRSLVSSSANDTVAGTGVQKVRVIYYRDDGAGNLSGPFVEVVPLNGTTHVVMAETALAYVERMEAAAVGSGGAGAAGTISMKAAAAGTGDTMASIAVGDLRTYLSHHFVPTGHQCRVSDLECIGGDAAAALVRLMVQQYPAGAAGYELPMTGQYGTTSTLPRGMTFPDWKQAPVVGPARIRLVVKPANGNSQVTVASFGWVEERAAAF